MSQVRSLELLSFEKLWWSVACSQYIWSCLLIIPALIEGASNKVEGHYCGLFEGRKYLTTLLLPKSELIQPKNATQAEQLPWLFYYKSNIFHGKATDTFETLFWYI